MVYRLSGRPTRILVACVMSLVFLTASTTALRPWGAQWWGSGTPLDRAARRALSIDPGNDRFQANLGTLYQYNLLLRDYPAALTAFQSALRSNPLDSASWLHLGKLYQKLDRPREADGALRLAIQLAPSNSTILWETTLAYLEEGQLTGALRTLSQFIAASWDSNDSAKGYDLARRLVPSEEVLQSVIPPGITPYTQYMQYLLDRNQGEEALRVWRRLKEMHPAGYEPTDPTLKLRLAELLMAGQSPSPSDPARPRRGSTTSP